MLEKLTNRRSSLPPLKCLPVFVAVAKHLSFTKAAAELCVTHSAVSQSIKQLEQFLQQSLFVRESRQVRLTPVGAEYLVDIQSALSLIRVATSKQLFSDSKVLTVNAGTSFVMNWLIPRLEDFQDKHENISLRISNIKSEQLDFSGSNVDCAVIFGQQSTNKSLFIEKLFDDHLVMVANPEVAAQMQAAMLPVLAEGVAAIFVDSNIRKGDWQHWCDYIKVELPQASQRLYFQSTVQAIQAAINGLGVLVTHKLLVQDHLQQRSLMLLGEDAVVTEHSYWFACPASLVKQDKIALFRHWLMQAIV